MTPDPISRLSGETRDAKSERRLRLFAVWAEIVSAVAVVVSLIFVGLEVRQSAEETSLSTRTDERTPSRGGVVPNLTVL